MMGDNRPNRIPCHRDLRPFYYHIPDVRWEIFEKSSHTPHLEEPGRFTAVLVAFLDSLREDGQHECRHIA
jgi:pimeloyl-ACP methyl ester carboxylesterase